MTDVSGRPFLAYSSSMGSAWCGDALELLPYIEDDSVHLICTSPPFALNRKKKYGNHAASDYIKWFRPFAEHFMRVLRPDGSLVIEIGGAWIPNSPTRSIYHFELLVDLVREVGFHLAEEFYWFNRAKLPSPAQWVTIERIRVKDAVNPIWWLSKTDRPNADNRRVLRPYSAAQRELMKRGTYNSGPRPSGHNISKKFTTDNGGAIPANLIEVANTSSNDLYNGYCERIGVAKHPARFPREVPEFFIQFLTTPNDLVLDPFAGSNMTGATCEQLGRRWLSYDLRFDYLDGSVGRFDTVDTTVEPGRDTKPGGLVPRADEHTGAGGPTTAM